MFHVKVYTTVGINNHLLCFVIMNAYQYLVIPETKLVSLESCSAHQSIGDENIYISMKSHVVNCSPSS